MDNHELYYDFNKNNTNTTTNTNTNTNTNINNNNNNDMKISYVYKFKLALYCFILFIILSNKNTYKILDFIVKIFRKNTNDIIDNDDNPLIFGIGIMGLIFALLIILLS
tara:strand:+ start:110 stop:436 length:327 start_codon:yes stop_codon:yes gene_type:complete